MGANDYPDHLQRASQAIQAVRTLASEAARHVDRLRETFEHMERELIAIGMAVGSKHAEEVGLRLARLQELRRMMEIGAFEIATNNAMQAAWRELP